MINILALIATIVASIPEQPPIATGLMQRYDPDLMEVVVENQINDGKIVAGTDPYMAVSVAGILPCSMIGTDVWVGWPNGKVTGPHPVVDCSAPQDKRRHIEKGLVVEVSYEFAISESIDCKHIYPRHKGGDYYLPLDGFLTGTKIYIRPILSPR